MTEKYTEDKRLLGALDYIDEKFIAEVTESYKIFEPSDGKITARRTLKITLRQFAALAACLILLSAAFPVTNYVVKAIKSFAAGWGSETAEESQMESNSEVIDSPYERAIDAYPEGMSAEEIYEDVLKGGWVVQDDDLSLKFDAGEDIWQNFLYSVDNKIPTSFLFASISDSIVRLSEISFNGDVFVIKQQFRSKGSIIRNERKEFSYLIKNEKMGRIYFFANDSKADPIMLSGYEVSMYDVEANFVLIWVD